jgi:hypothetical protein
MMRSFFGKIIDRVFAVIGAFVFCQIPELIRQYTALLYGHLSESKTQVVLLEQNALSSGKTIPEYIQKFLQQTDPDFVRQGKMLQTLVTRHDDLSTSYTALSQASLWTKPFVFFSKVNFPILHEATGQFVPTLAFTLETAIYALVGICFGVLVYRLLAKGFCALFSKEAVKK